MLNHKITDILKTFSSDDIKKFREFLDSPFYNKNKKIRKLYTSLIGFHPDYKSPRLTKQSLHNKINSGTPYNDSSMQSLLADIFHLAESYLTQINIRSKEIRSRDFLINELFKRNLYRLIESNIKRSDDQIKDIKNIGADYYMNNFKIITDKLNHLSTNKPKKNSSVINSYIDMLADRGKYLTYFFVSEIIAEHDDLLALNKSFEIDKNSNFVFRLFKTMDFKKVMGFLVKYSGNKKISLVFEIYYYLYMAFSNSNNSKTKNRYYYKYKKLFLASLKMYSQDEKRLHFGKLSRYCKNKSAGNKKFQRELFNLYNIILDKGYYRSEISDYLPVELYRTILFLGLKLNEYKWTENFIKNFSKKLHPDRSKNMYNYALGEYCFKRGRYKKVLNYFHNIEQSHFMLKLDLKNTMLRTYYELNEFKSALHLINTYKQFLLKNKTLSTKEKNIHRNFLNILYKLIRSRSSDTRYPKRYSIVEDLKKDVLHKEWFLEKAV